MLARSAREPFFSTSSTQFIDRQPQGNTKLVLAKRSIRHQGLGAFVKPRNLPDEGQSMAKSTPEQRLAFPTPNFINAIACNIEAGGHLTGRDDSSFPKLLLHFEKRQCKSTKCRSTKPDSGLAEALSSPS
jgi:hypothetical protein